MSISYLASDGKIYVDIVMQLREAFRNLTVFK